MANKKIIVVLVILCMVLGVAFAAGQKETGVTGKSGRPVIRVGSMAYYLSVPLQVIMDEKLDEKYGFELQIIDFPSGGPMAEALGAGQWDIGPIGAGGMIAIPNYNAKLIADVESEMDGAWIIARPDSKIVKAGKTLAKYPDIIGSAEALKGQTLLGTVGNISHYMAIDYVSKFGLAMSDVNFIHMETAQVYTAFTAGNGDIACIGSPAAGQKLLAEGNVLIGGLKQQGNSQQDAILVSDDFYTNHYDLCVTFMKAWYTATTKLNADSEYEVAMAKKFYTTSGRTDVSDSAVREECSWNTYVDLHNINNQKPVGTWMSNLIQTYVEAGTMEKSVIDALKNNIRLDVSNDAIAALSK
ncbi:MAG: ABC transporter substrate-binding protein [Sphaerochaeta sp.]|jgi:NitT/TauT family transport system substrate-binding protein|uniref:ABC transporter substrate-binding protein n=1 Tax=Sphaerochaeta sp. TaxID=1972642 RepID=UPI003D102503